MSDFAIPDQEAKDHGNLMDLEVAEIERESAEADGGEIHSQAVSAAEPNGPPKPVGASAGQAAEFLAEQSAEAQDSVT
jgi:hypothetical protein